MSSHTYYWLTLHYFTSQIKTASVVCNVSSVRQSYPLFSLFMSENKSCLNVNSQELCPAWNKHCKHSTNDNPLALPHCKTWKNLTPWGGIFMGAKKTLLPAMAKFGRGFLVREESSCSAFLCLFPLRNKHDGWCTEVLSRRIVYVCTDN